jgi:hypothetical protein
MAAAPDARDSRGATVDPDPDPARIAFRMMGARRDLRPIDPFIMEAIPTGGKPLRSSFLVLFRPPEKRGGLGSKLVAEWLVP